MPTAARLGFAALALAGCTGGTFRPFSDGGINRNVDFAGLDLSGVDLAGFESTDMAIAPGADLSGCADNDFDGVTTCAGDCDDSDPLVHPGAKPQCNGKDNDCNGTIDNQQDSDGDGYPVCMDCNDADPIVNPGAMEVPGDGVDNNCNGQVDEAPAPCDGNIPSNTASASDFARSIEICPNQFFVSATFATLADPRAHQVAPDYGIYTPQAGVSFAALSTGIAADENDAGYVLPQQGTEFANSVANPIPMGMNCGGQDAATVFDYTELKLVLKAPTNAKSFAFDFNFLSAEYPEYVCTEFNDKFLVILDSAQVKGNISFDAKGNPVTINNGFFSVTAANQLGGTGYEVDDGTGVPIGGGTDWLTTTSPVTPGEQITVRFIVFDEGDHILDSAVLIDNFRWSLMPATGPMTGRDGGAGGA